MVEYSSESLGRLIYSVYHWASIYMLLTNDRVTQHTVVCGPLSVAHALCVGYLLSLQGVPCG